MQTDSVREAAGGRHGLVLRVLTDALGGSGPGRVATPHVLDCGGGSGTFAVPLAAAGADVTVVDISADALAILRRRADEVGVSDRVHAVPGDIEALGELVPTAHFDLVLAHGVLGAVDDVAGALQVIAAAVRPGGLFSVLVDNPVASVLGRALAGEPAAALAELRSLDAAAHPAGPEAVGRECMRLGLTIEQRRGIGVFSDLVPGSFLDAPGARVALAELDALAAARAPFAELAGRILLLARRAPSRN